MMADATAVGNQISFTRYLPVVALYFKYWVIAVKKPRIIPTNTITLLYENSMSSGGAIFVPNILL